MNANVAVYAGHFDPITLGHLDLVDRAAKVFDRLIVAVAKDSPKTAVFSAEERMGMLSEILAHKSNVEVDVFEGLLSEYVRRRGARVLVRGIRTVSDFEYEFQMALANKKMCPDMETFFMMTGGDFSYLSSTLIKEIARLGGDVGCMVPRIVAERLRRHYETQSTLRG